MEKMLIINGSPRDNGVSAELINQVKKYFIDCEIKQYDTYKMAPAPCTDCRYCEYHNGCSNKDLDFFFYDFEQADSNARQCADYMNATLKQAFTVLNGGVCARYYIPDTDSGAYTFNLVELEKFVHQLKR